MAQRAHTLLADVPRLGKTRTTLLALAMQGVERALVVCPALVRPVWRAEARTLGLPASLLDVRSYQEIVMGASGKLDASEYSALVLDEAHYLANPEAQRTRLLLRRHEGYAHHIPIVHALTATPVPRYPVQFAPLLLTLWPAVAREHGLRSIEDVRQRYCIEETRWVRRGHMRQEVRKIVGVQNADEFADILLAVMLRREIADVLPALPPVDWQFLRVEPEAGWRSSLTLDEEAALRGMLDLAPMARDTELVQSARQKLGLQKVSAGVQWVTAALEDPAQKVVVFAYHRSVIDALELACIAAGVRPVVIHGGTRADYRQQRQQKFAQDANCRVLLGQIDTCQTGINLSAATLAIFVEPAWTPDANYQASQRIVDVSRPDRRCQVQVLLAGGLDEGLLRQVLRESAMLAQVGLPQTGGMLETV